MSNKIKPTNGKWKVVDRNSGSIKISVNPHNPVKENTICTLAGYATDPEVKSNARLMVEAKPMYALIKKILLAGVDASLTKLARKITDRIERK